MTITLEKTVREIATETPASIRVFEKFGIDYCCGGRKSLEQACAELQLSSEQVIEKLDEATRQPAEPEPGQWQQASLASLVQHIVRRHHSFVRKELPRLEQLAEKVLNRHGQAHPELGRIRDAFLELRDELSEHMMKEEQILFPHIVRAEHALQARQSAPDSCFGTVANPIAMMMHEHDTAGSLIAEIRTLSGNFVPPPTACPSYQGLYAGFHDFEQDLHRHIHLENNILFPRAVEMEKLSS
ncbi:MAG: iron-sulfur cluster repair di-iron protein [Acidobacteriia bacterium]|nr:iron-sulfur cluster repair di-iron protein [Terriglobia bacterium]